MDKIETARRNVIGFIRRIQAQEEHVRRRWLIGLTGVSMAIVIGGWVGFLNLSLSFPPAPTQEARATKSAGIADVFAAGLAVTVDELRSLAGSFVATISGPFRKTTDITIEREPYTFNLETLPPVPPTPLP